MYIYHILYCPSSSGLVLRKRRDADSLQNIRLESAKDGIIVDYLNWMDEGNLSKNQEFEKVGLAV